MVGTFFDETGFDFIDEGLELVGGEVVLGVDLDVDQQFVGVDLHRF